MRNDRLRRSNDNKVFTKYLKRRIPEEDIILKALTSSVKQLKKKLISVENEKRKLEEINEELMRKHGVQNTMVRKRVVNTVQIVATLHVGMTTSISEAISNSCLKEISEVDHFSGDLRRN